MTKPGGGDGELLNWDGFWELVEKAYWRNRSSIIDPYPQKDCYMQTAKFTRKSFEVDAVQVTADNMDEIAKWCQGKVIEDTEGKHIKVRVERVLTDKQTMAFVGDWVLYAGKGYKVYTNKAFQQSFDPVEKNEELRTVSA